MELHHSSSIKSDFCLTNAGSYIFMDPKWGDEDFDRRYDLDDDVQITVADIMRVATQWRNTCATP